MAALRWGQPRPSAKQVRWPAYPTDIYSTDDHLRALGERYAKAANLVRAAIDKADEAGDADTADIFTAYSRALDKALWFIEAHLQN